MNKKDLSKIKKIISKKEDTPIRRVASCYIDVSKSEPRYQDPEMFEMLDDAELEQFLAFFKKSLTGNLGTTAFELNTRDANVLIDEIRKDELNKTSLIEKVCESVRDTIKMDDNYCVYFAFGAYDVPPDEEREMDSEEVYNFVLVMIQPCKLSKPGIKYDYPNNNFKDRTKDRLLEAPIISFLYPSFDEGHTDIDHAMCFIKNAKNRENYQDLVNALFDTSIPASVETQKEGFYNIVSSGHNYNLPYEALQNVYEELNQIRVDSEMTGDEIKLTANDICDIVKREANIPKEKEDEINAQVAKYAMCEFSLDNIAPKTIGVKTDKATFKVDLTEIGSIKKKMIDGIEYFLIPVDNATVEDMGVH